MALVQGKTLLPTILLFVLFVIIVGVTVLQSDTSSPNQSQPSFQPPHVSTEGWESITSGGVTFLAPHDLATTYISVVDWPPTVQIVSEPFSCTEAGSDTDRAGGTVQKTIGDREYCMTTISEGAAGSTYVQYAYETVLEGRTTIFTFSLRFVGCGNYDDSQKTACEAERASFSIDPIIDTIVSTAKV